ncbi:hypothetical protein N7509_000850, partial [Penicillium cosmopolitanum]
SPVSLSSQTQQPVSCVPLGLRNKIRLKTSIGLHSRWLEIWEALKGHQIATDLSSVVLLEHCFRIMNNTVSIAKPTKDDTRRSRDYCLQQKGRLFQRQYDSSRTKDEGTQIASTIPAFLLAVS